MTLRVGVIGLGEVAQLMHLPILADDPRFEIAAVCDISPTLTAVMAQRYRARAATTAQEIFRDARIDAVFILTPDHLHAYLIAAAVEADKHVFVEKPVCLNLETFAPLEALDSDRIVFVGYMRRYAQPFLALKERLPSASEIRHVRIRDIIRESLFFVSQTRPVIRAKDIAPETLEEGRNRTLAMLRDAIGADAPDNLLRAYQVLTGLASHSFSAMRELLGMPRGIAAARQHDGETVIVLFDYERFTVTYEAVISDVARFDAGIEVLTQNRRLAIGFDTPYIRHLPTQLEVTTSSEHATGTEIIGPFYQDPFAIELNAFFTCVTNGTVPKTSLSDAREDLVLFQKVGQALRLGAGLAAENVELFGKGQGIG